MLIFIIGVAAVCSAIVVTYILYKAAEVKISNPKVKEFERNIKKRNLLLVKGNYRTTSIFIKDTDEFLRFAKRSKVGTIFKEDCEHYNEIYYFYIVNSFLVTTCLPSKVKAK